MFLVDKYSPKNIDDFGFHKDILDQLKILSEDDSIPHTIFYGPEGSGKKSLIYLFLKMIYDDSVFDLSEVTYNVSGSSTEIQVKVKQSNYHLVIEPNNNNSDRYLIQGVLNKYVKKNPLNVFVSKRNFKVVLINNVDNLSYYTQAALRRMMEKYSNTCRFILWCRSLNKVIDPIVSRCLSIRVGNPTDDDLLTRLFHISSLERININFDILNNIIKKSKGNIKNALWLLNLEKYNYTDDNVYENEIKEISNKILECKISNLHKIRDMIYKIIITNFDESTILNDILDFFLNTNKIDTNTKIKIVEETANVEFNLKRGRREIIHLEAFVQNIMYWIREYKKISK